MANLAWHQKYHPNKACEFDNAIDYNAHLLRLVDRQVDKPDTTRESEKTAYRVSFAVNDQEFRTLRSADACPIEKEFVGFEELIYSSPPPEVPETDFEESVSQPPAEVPEDAPIQTKEKPFFSPAEKKTWIRRAMFGGLAISTLAVAAALGYWAFKPKKPAIRFQG